jgi:vancomycin resistance protein YoaR
VSQPLLNVPQSEPPPVPGLVGDGQPSRAPRALIVTGSVIIVLLGLFTVAQWAFADRVPAGTVLAGVNISGMSTAEAIIQLETGLAPQVREPIRIKAGDASTTLDPATAGLALDARATVEQFTGFSFSPVNLWRHVVGGNFAQSGLVVTLDETKFAAALDTLSEQLATKPISGTVAYLDGQPIATRAVAGTTVVTDGVAEKVRSSWLVMAPPVELTTEPIEPDITQEETNEALAQARRIVSGPVTINVGTQRPELPAATLAQAVTFRQIDGGLVPQFDGDALAQGVLDRTLNLLGSPVNARFEFQDGVPVIVGGDPGTALDADAVASAVGQAALTSATRSADLALAETPPEVTRESLEALGIREVVSSFSTPLTAEVDRTENLARGAELVTGVLLLPDEVFSLIDALSPIDESNGFIEAGIINEGIHTQGIGGGLSQMATTTFNAGYFAGFQNVEHTPHSVWLPRYPAGREATIFVGSIDMKFRNNTPYGALMRSYIANNQLTVEIWSTKYFTVETTASERTNITPTTTKYSDDPECVGYPAGQPGFTITNYRTVTAPDGTIVENAVPFTWTYQPDHAVVCGAPPPGS